MMDIAQIRPFFPPVVRDNPSFQKYMLKEYIQLQILDFLSSTDYIRKLIFIGGTNLRLIKGIDRFSEDLDFDCKDFSAGDFDQMTFDVVQFLRRQGWNAEAREKSGSRLTAFRANLFFPGLLFSLNLSGHRDERFLIKLECQDQLVNYKPQMVNIKGCGLFFPFPVPPDAVLLSMKLAAMLGRAKGRDFYDVMFLSGQARPDYDFLSARCGLHSESELNSAVSALLARINLEHKALDFDHLVFNQQNSRRILQFAKYAETFLNSDI